MSQGSCEVRVLNMDTVLLSVLPVTLTSTPRDAALGDAPAPSRCGGPGRTTRPLQGSMSSRESGTATARAALVRVRGRSKVITRHVKRVINTCQCTPDAGPAGNRCAPGGSREEGDACFPAESSRAGALADYALNGTCGSPVPPPPPHRPSLCDRAFFLSE